MGVMARRAAAASGMAPADAAAIAAAAAVASEEEVAHAASSGSGSGSGSALTGAEDDREGGLSWRLRAEDLLGCMATGGADILLNTRLDDNITGEHLLACYLLLAVCWLRLSFCHNAQKLRSAAVAVLPNRAVALSSP